MAKTLLDGINDVLKRVGVIVSDSGELTTLNDSARQHFIDIAIQVINEGIDELYSSSGKAHPIEQAESTIVLAEGTRSYALEDDLVQLRFPLIDRTNNQYMFHYPGGYNQILILDPEQDDTGIPYYAAISPVNNELYLDKAPTAADAGKTYHYQYDKDLALSAAADSMPFSDAVHRSMVPAWVQLWKREARNQFDGDLFSHSIGRASRLMTKRQPRADYFPR